jgi:dihydroorotate dehydrogenase electron transfer subunit
MSAAPQLAGAPTRTAAPFGRRSAPVLDNAAIGTYRVLRVRDPDGASAPPRPGQFYMLATAADWGAERDERPYLPRAFSVLRSHASADALEHEFLLEEVGPGTARLGAVAAGDKLWLTGPLGRGFSAPLAHEGAAPSAETELPVLLVGGGVGIAPLAIWQDELAAAGVAVRVLLGFRDAGRAAGAVLLTGATIATDDGSVGHHGLVTELLESALDAGPTSVYACGPAAMLEAVRRICGDRGAPAQLALEAPMACGYGACFGCVVPTADGGYRRVCVDGPVFDATELAPIPPIGHGG